MHQIVFLDGGNKPLRVGPLCQKDINFSLMRKFFVKCKDFRVSVQVLEDFWRTPETIRQDPLQFAAYQWQKVCLSRVTKNRRSSCALLADLDLVAERKAQAGRDFMQLPTVLRDPDPEQTPEPAQLGGDPSPLRKPPPPPPRKAPPPPPRTHSDHDHPLHDNDFDRRHDRRSGRRRSPTHSDHDYPHHDHAFACDDSQIVDHAAYRTHSDHDPHPPGLLSPDFDPNSVCIGTPCILGSTAARLSPTGCISEETVISVASAPTVVGAAPAALLSSPATASSSLSHLSNSSAARHPHRSVEPSSPEGDEHSTLDPWSEAGADSSSQRVQQSTSDQIPTVHQCPTVLCTSEGSMLPVDAERSSVGSQHGTSEAAGSAGDPAVAGSVHARRPSPEDVRRPMRRLLDPIRRWMKRWFTAHPVMKVCLESILEDGSTGTEGSNSPVTGTELPSHGLETNGSEAPDQLQMFAADSIDSVALAVDSGCTTVPSFFAGAQ